MANEPTPLIWRETPRQARRRRQAQQQSSCCCCMIVVFSLLIALIVWHQALLAFFRGRAAEKAAPPAATFPLELATDAPQYLRYQLVKIYATVQNVEGRRETVARPLTLSVSHHGETIKTIGDFTSVTARYNQNSQLYEAYWPIPWNAPLGEYIVEASVQIDNPAAWPWQTPAQKREKQRKQGQRRAKEVAPMGVSLCVARARFMITGRAPDKRVLPGTCVATWEPDFPSGKVARPDGSRGDWRALFDWCEFIGADTLWFRGAVTQATPESPLTLEQPFKKWNLEAVPRLATEAHHRGLRFGAWAAAYATYPHHTNRYKPGYQYAQDISRRTGAIRSLDFVSLLDTRRRDHLAAFLSQLEANPHVDFLGLDYFRSDRGGYEMTDRFAREMPLRLPADFWRWSQQRRWMYVANKIERQWQSDPRFYDAWNWWRAHLMSENLQAIISQGRLTKPLWIFVLSWWHGKQHGQDPIMFTDAGASFLAPMLYQVSSRAMFDQMVQDWHEYVGEGQANLMPGDQVDFYWHQNTLQPAAPEELYNRIITAHQKYQNSGFTIGAFWHDISRATTNVNNGPYPGTEWALAGGAAFSTIRMNWRVYPLVAKLEMPRTAPLNTTIEGQLVLQNVVKRSVKRIRLRLEKTEGVELAEALADIPSLGARQTLTVPISVRLKSGHSDRRNRLCVCVRITWADDDYGPSVRRDLPRLILVMNYVQGK